MRFSGTRADFVACGMMQELEAEDNAKSASSPTTEKKENPIEELAKPTHKSVASLSGAGDVQLSEPNSETSSLAPEDEMTVTSSTPDLKQKAPRKLVEDEKRATGRVAWVVWKLYFTSLGGPFWCMSSSHSCSELDHSSEQGYCFRLLSSSPCFYPWLRRVGSSKCLHCSKGLAIDSAGTGRARRQTSPVDIRPHTTSLDTPW